MPTRGFPFGPGSGTRFGVLTGNDTLNGRLDLEERGGRTFEGVAIRVARRVLAMAAGIWHNNKLGAPVTRSPGR